MINNRNKVRVLKIEAAIIGRAIHPDLPLVDSLGVKLSKASNKAFTAKSLAFSAASFAFSPASLAISPAFSPAFLAASPASFAISPALSAASLGLISMWLYLGSSISASMDRFFTSPDLISSEVGAN
jgi:hypothetical protein